MALDENKIIAQQVWAMKGSEVLKLLDTSESGLTEKEAKSRIGQFGENILPKIRKRTGLRIFLRQFRSPLIIILLIAGFITLFLQDFKDSGFIFAAVLVNAALGFYQENKAETALEKLETYIKERVRVVRGGQEREIDANGVVPGDIIRLVSGMRIPADARVVMSNELLVDEAVLTGESLPASKSEKPAKKDASVADQESMVFSGTLVSGGVGLAVVVRTGSNTELGKIAALIGGKDRDETPLQLAIKIFSLKVGIILFLLSAGLFFVGTSLGYDTFDMFLISVAVAVSAVPEGLPIALTVVLAVGVERLAKRKGVVRRLSAAEALGSATVIMTDKTGTLTEARMELAEIMSDWRNEEVLKFAILATDTVVENPDSPPKKWHIIGRPVETAIVRAGIKHKLLLPELRKKQETLAEKPFNSTDKYAAVKVKIDSEKHWIYLGAPDILAEKSGLKKPEKEKLLEQLDKLASYGYRVLGVAVDKDFLGLMAFNDPVRKGVKKAIRDVTEAGVKTVIVTGDHKGTAVAVAKEVGIDANSNQVMTGGEVQKLSDDALKKKLPSIRVFARVTPADKLRIAKLYKERGETVAVTGDGVNDAPALEGADIGIAVGSGTDVAKGAADLVILDDNFETIVAAIGEGRRILENIRKVLVYLFSDALDELILIGGSIIMGIPIPLNALQILWVNFFDDSFPAIALAFESDGKSLRNTQIHLKKRLIDPEMRFLILVIGIISSAFLLGLYVYLLWLDIPIELAQTFIFGSFALYTMFLVFSVKSLRKSIFSYNPFDNLYLVAGVLFGIGLTLIAIYLPAAQGLLNTVSLPWPWLLGVVGVGFLNIAGVEFGKFIFRKSF